MRLTHLKKIIPYVDRSKRPVRPGHLSADTAAHCNGDISGDFVWTRTVTDELTGRTQSRAIGNRGQYAACRALHHILREAPFRVRPVNTDKGSEFVNRHLQHPLRCVFILRQYGGSSLPEAGNYQGLF